ncbi:hypothetical protein FRB97_004333, partial [Tulasnella sp. 331]
MRIEEELLGYAYLAGDPKKNAVPKTLKEAMESEDWKNWKEAMDVEMAQLNKMGTWELMELPAGRTAIGCRWVLALKFDAAGNLQQYKARLVTQGYTQIPSVDYTETYSPTICLDSQRTIFTLATIYSYDIQQMDIKTAHLYGELEEEIYMRQLEGYNDGTERDNIHHDFITVWVDDLTAISKDTTATSAIKRDISTKFELKDLGSPTLLIGIQINRNPCKQLLTMSQSNYTVAILDRFNMANCHAIATPMDISTILTAQTNNDPAFDKSVYAQ